MLYKKQNTNSNSFKESFNPWNILSTQASSNTMFTIFQVALWLEGFVFCRVVAIVSRVNRHIKLNGWILTFRKTNKKEVM